MNRRRRSFVALFVLLAAVRVAAEPVPSPRCEKRACFNPTLGCCPNVSTEPFTGPPNGLGLENPQECMCGYGAAIRRDLVKLNTACAPGVACVANSFEATCSGTDCNIDQTEMATHPGPPSSGRRRYTLTDHCEYFKCFGCPGAAGASSGQPGQIIPGSCAATTTTSTSSSTSTSRTTTTSTSTSTTTSSSTSTTLAPGVTTTTSTSTSSSTSSSTSTSTSSTTSTTLTGAAMPSWGGSSNVAAVICLDEASGTRHVCAGGPGLCFDNAPDCDFHDLGAMASTLDRQEGARALVGDGATILECNTANCELFLSPGATSLTVLGRFKPTDDVQKYHDLISTIGSSRGYSVTWLSAAAVPFGYPTHSIQTGICDGTSCWANNTTANVIPVGSYGSWAMKFNFELLRLETFVNGVRPVTPTNVGSSCTIDTDCAGGGDGACNVTVGRCNPGLAAATHAVDIPGQTAAIGLLDEDVIFVGKLTTSAINRIHRCRLDGTACRCNDDGAGNPVAAFKSCSGNADCGPTGLCSASGKCEGYDIGLCKPTAGANAYKYCTITTATADCGGSTLCEVGSMPNCNVTTPPVGDS